MTAKDLLKAIETLAEAPHGVARLRELILSLAVRGKLVPQEPTDEPASRLLERIQAEKARLVKEGKLKKQEPLPPIKPEEMPFEVPEGWEWVPFGEIFVEMFTGPFGSSLKAADYVSEGTPVVNPQNMRSGKLVPSSDTCVDRETLERLSSFALRENDIVVARRGELGRCAVVQKLENGWLCGTGSFVLRPPRCLNVDFVTIFFRSPFTLVRLAQDSVGSTMANLNQRIMLHLPCPLPPLAEQHRIVSRVDELMGLLDRLEAARAAREVARVAHRESALAQLRDANTPEEVEIAWLRVSEGLRTLVSAPEDVASLRQTVLQLAVRGKLVPQDPNDEPASQLLERIAAEKARLVKEGKIKAPKPLPPLSKDELPFEVPRGWEWGLMEHYFDITGGIQKSGKRRPGSNAYPYLRVANVQRGYLLLSEIAEFELFDGELERYALAEGDLLVVEGNGSEQEIGRCARWDGSIKSCVHQNHLIRCRPLHSSIEYFALLYLNSPAGKDRMKSLAVTTSGLYNLSVGKIKGIPIPLPPLSEQHRIVSRVDALMGLLDRLEGHLKETREAQDAYASSVVVGFEG